MRGLFWLIIVVALGCSAALAERLPPDGSQKLTQILSAPEFQPRSVNPGWRERLGQYLMHQAQEFLNRIEDWGRNNAIDSWLPQGLRNFLGNLAAMLKQLGELLGALAQTLVLVLLLAALWIFARIAYSYLRPYFQESGNIAPLGEERAELTAANLNAYLSAGQYSALLEGLRLILRGQFERRYALQSGMTDREMLGAAPRGLAALELFRDASLLFEQRAFEGGTLDADAVVSLFGRFCRIADRP
ncbi:MAG: hypothetical protein K1X83_05550 [Oligoflexia bacterium]|nr:hypothetical protein [Oligoflexia bacterium]